jgi:hypothetical protein
VSLPLFTPVIMAPNYGLFYGVGITTLCIAVICFTLRLSNRFIKRVISFVRPTKVLRLSTAQRPLLKIDLIRLGFPR